MQSDGRFNEVLGYLKSPSTEVVTLHEADGLRISAARGRSYRHDNGLTADHPLEDAFTVSLQLIDYAGALSLNGRPLPDLRQPAGYVTSYDYRMRWQGDLMTPFDCINFHLPRGALNALIGAAGFGAIDHLTMKPGTTVADPVILGLGQALLPALARPKEVSELFAGHIANALALHVVQLYGEGSVRSPRKPGTLAIWQERRAKDLIASDLATNPRLADLAAACGLSGSHFIRAFKRTTGVPPHRWLLLQRVERAKAMLLDPRFSIAEIATACGFADQSHLSRVFLRAAGQSPAVWRKAAIL